MAKVGGNHGTLLILTHWGNSDIALIVIAFGADLAWNIRQCSNQSDSISGIGTVDGSIWWRPTKQQIGLWWSSGPGGWNGDGRVGRNDLLDWARAFFRNFFGPFARPSWFEVGVWLDTIPLCKFCPRDANLVSSLRPYWFPVWPLA